VLYVGNSFEVALFETIYHHQRFMARTQEAPGWTSQFREIVMNIDATLHDLRVAPAEHVDALNPNDHTAGQTLATQLCANGSDGVVYPSRRYEEGECVGLFYPDLANHPVQGRHLDYHWDGKRVDLCRIPSNGEVFRIVDEEGK
jgi:hypothetical protein